MTAYRPVRHHWLQARKLKQNANEGCNSCATVVQVLRDLFYVLLHVLFYLWSLLKMTFKRTADTDTPPVLPRETETSSTWTSWRRPDMQNIVYVGWNYVTTLSVGHLVYSSAVTEAISGCQTADKSHKYLATPGNYFQVLKIYFYSFLITTSCNNIHTFAAFCSFPWLTW